MDSSHSFHNLVQPQSQTSMHVVMYMQNSLKIGHKFLCGLKFEKCIFAILSIFNCMWIRIIPCHIRPWNKYFKKKKEIVKRVRFSIIWIVSSNWYKKSSFNTYQPWIKGEGVPDHWTGPFYSVSHLLIFCKSSNQT